MDKLILTTIERELIVRLCGLVLWAKDDEWADIAKEADKLLDSDIPISQYSDGNLRHCIAYTSYKLSITTGSTIREDREHLADMYHDFWFCVAELARRRMVGR